MSAVRSASSPMASGCVTNSIIGLIYFSLNTSLADGPPEPGMEPSPETGVVKKQLGEGAPALNPVLGAPLAEAKTLEASCKLDGPVRSMRFPFE